MASGRRIEIDYSKIYESKNYGKYVILEESEPRQSGEKIKRVVKIRFILTGTETVIDLLAAIRGVAVDPYYPTVAGGIGCLGKYNKDLHSKQIYDIWFHMLGRCYNKSDYAYPYYGERGVHVCSRWFCYEYFLEDAQYLPGYDEYIESINNNGPRYQLDKDGGQYGIENKIYSPETCRFVPAVTNMAYMARDNKNKRSSQYYGVHKLEENGHYQSSVNINGKKHFLGTFKDEIDAAIAYNNEVLMYSDARCHNLNEFIIAKVVENKKEENKIIFAKVVK